MIFRSYSSFSSWCNNVIIAKDPIENHLLHLAVVSLKSSSIWNSFPIFPRLWRPWSFWKWEATCFIEYPAIEFVWLKSQDSIQFCIFDRSIIKMMQCSLCCILPGGTWFYFAPLLMMSTLIIWLTWYLPCLSTEKLLPLPIHPPPPRM